MNFNFEFDLYVNYAHNLKTGRLFNDPSVSSSIKHTFTMNSITLYLKCLYRIHSLYLV